MSNIKLVQTETTQEESEALKALKNLTWEQKLFAISKLCDTSLKMRKPGDWYVSSVGIEVAGDGVLIGEYGNGTTPQEAVEEEWRKLVTDLPDGKYLRVHDYRHGEKPRYVRWNGIWWREVPRTINGKVVEN